MMEDEDIAYDKGPVQLKDDREELKKEVNNDAPSPVKSAPTSQPNGSTRRRNVQEHRGAEEKDAVGLQADHIQANLSHAIRMSGTETLGGMYALLLTSLGIAFPVSQYTSSSSDARMRDNFDIGFGLYVYVISLVFQLYITTAVRFYKSFKHQFHPNIHRHQHSKAEIETEFGGAHHHRKQGSTGDVYVIDSGNDVLEPGKHGRDERVAFRDVPWHQWHKLAPAIYSAKYGFNLFTRIGVLLFGLSAIALDVCRLIEYSQHANRRCYNDALRALSVIRIIFFVFQSLFLFIHHKVVLNFHHAVIKIGLLHLVSTNLIAWIDMIAVTAVDIVALDASGSFSSAGSSHSGAASSIYHPSNSSLTHHYTTTTMSHHLVATTSGHHVANTTDAYVDTDSLAYRLCLDQESNIAVSVSRSLGPLVIGYCVLAASLIYKMYKTVGPDAYIYPLPAEVWEKDTVTAADNEQIITEKKCRKPNWGFVAGITLFLATMGITCWYIQMDSWKTDTRYLRTLGRIHTGCDLFWNVVALIALVPGFYSLNKLKYLHNPVSAPESLLVACLGGTFILLGFMAVASFMFINDDSFGGSAKMAVPGCIMNFVQSSAMFVFVADAWRRRMKTATDLGGKDTVTFLIWANFSMWLVTSFQWKISFGSYLFRERFGTLAWVLIINSALPLAMFFRFLCCIMLTDVLRTTYGVHKHRLRTLCSG